MGFLGKSNSRDKRHKSSPFPAVPRENGNLYATPQCIWVGGRPSKSLPYVWNWVYSIKVLKFHCQKLLRVSRGNYEFEAIPSREEP